MHPVFCVYNPETLLKLRAAVGDRIGANFDPSHLIWQGIDPALAIKQKGLEKAIKFLRDVIISEPRPSGMFWA